AGAAYTLLDPDFPDERLRSAAADAGISLLLTAPAHAARVEGAWPTVLFPAHEDLAAFPADALETGPTGDDAACLMFTSGS
ncbi:AMP-binding protein, partial [Streptomyces cinereoruber]